MPKFSNESFSKLSTCHVDLQTLFYEIIKHFDCTILEGYRNAYDQEKDFHNGKSELQYPNSKHNTLPSNAIDVAPYPIDWSNSKRFYWFAGIVLGIAQRLKDEGKIAHSIRWGGDWNGDMKFDNEKFRDLVHFEIV